MTKVELRISDLREAAERLRRAGRRIDLSLVDVQAILDQLFWLSGNDPATANFTALYNQHRTEMEIWSQQLLAFSIQLTAAADDMEFALLDRQDTWDYAAAVPLGAPPLRFHLALPNHPPVTENKPLSPALPLTAFIATVNRPLYDQLIQQQQLLQSQQAQLDELLRSRQETLSDLAGLRNRLVSYNPNIDFAHTPRVQALEAEIARLDREILSTRENITGLQVDADGLTARLERVSPGPGADLNLIARLEGAETSESIRVNTHDCVNYIVNRMAIPDGIPRHAYLWDQAAAQLTQYGITSGDVPLAGAVIVLEPAHSYADDVFGHLLYVERVENGVVWVTDNLHPDKAVRLTDLTDELTGPNITYLYFPWNTQA